MKLQNEMFTIVGCDNGRTQIRLNPAHTIYQAHFPGNPITPGVCIVQIVGELLQGQTGQALRLQKIVNLKFVSTLSPTDTPVVDVCLQQVTAADGVVKAKGTLEAGDTLFTKFSLVFGSTGAAPEV